MEDDLDKLMSIPKGGAELGVSTSKMYRLVRQGHIEVTKLDGFDAMVTRRQLRRFLAKMAGADDRSDDVDADIAS